MSLWRSGTSTAPWTAGSLHSLSHLIRRSRGCILRTHRGWCCQPHSDGRSGLEGLGDLQRQTPMINSYTAQLVLKTRDPHWVSVFKVRSKDLRCEKTTTRSNVCCWIWTVIILSKHNTTSAGQFWKDHGRLKTHLSSQSHLRNESC